MNADVYIGKSCQRRGDDQLLKGEGIYTADISLQAPLHISFVRASMPNATITAIDVEAANEMEGVRAIHTGAELSGLGRLSVNRVIELTRTLPYPVLANKAVDAVGQPIAAVLADSSDRAADAAGQVVVDFQPLVSAIVCEPDFSKREDVLFSAIWENGDVEGAFGAADHIARFEIQHPRVSPCPLENRAIAISYDRATESATVWLSTQTPHRARQELCSILNIDPERLHVVAPNVGGAFGMKASLYPEEVFAVWAAFKHRNDVRWVAERGEDFLSASHGRGIKSRGELAFDREGKFLAMTASVVAPVGMWMTNSSQIPAWNAARILPGPYEIDCFSFQTKGVYSNTTPVGIYRGAGRPEAAFLMECLVDKAARHLAMDPIEIRDKNLVRPTKLPLQRTTGTRLDSGDFPLTLKRLEELSEYQLMRQKQAGRREKGELVGIGIGFFVEPCGRGWESATITASPDGVVMVNSGGSSQGHGRAITFAQIAADALGCKIDNVTVTWGDTRTDPAGIGALASRSTAIGGSAILAAAKKLLARCNGEFPPTERTEISVKYHTEHEAWGHGAYLAQVSIEPGTGVLSIEKIVCVDDAGTLINPQLVKGQVLGGIVQGIGEVIQEAHFYDTAGQLITGTLMDYALPRADQVPEVTVDHIQTPTDSNLLGVKGVGEAGTIGAPCAIYNAALDALTHLNVDQIELPLSSHHIWNAIRKAEENGYRYEI